MKSSFLIILSFLLVAAILAPSIITLTDSNQETAAIMDFNEEENNKEEKKELGEQDFLYASNVQLSTLKSAEASLMVLFYTEGNYSSTMDVFLPPPESL